MLETRRIKERRVFELGDCGNPLAIKSVLKCIALVTRNDESFRITTKVKILGTIIDMS